MEEERKIEELQRLIDTHENIVFFGGAGVSTESGIPDFRSVDGLYHQKYWLRLKQVKRIIILLKRKSEFFG